MRLSSRETARIFGALSDTTRVEIVRLVAKAPRNVTQLTSLVGVSQPKVSRHLRILRDAGLVRDVRRGKWVWYELAEPSRGQPGSMAVAAVSGLFSAVTSGTAAASSGKEALGTLAGPAGFAETAEVRPSLKTASSKTASSAPIGRRATRAPRAVGLPAKRSTQRAGKGKRRRAEASPNVPTRPSRRESAPKRRSRPPSRPPKGAGPKSRASRKKKETPRRELEDFLL